MPARCPCSSGRTYDDCCRPALQGVTPAATAERLMRSRYTAFALGDRDYLLRTWHRSTRPGTLELDPSLTWVSLQIVSRTGGSLLETSGTVEFVASYRAAGRLHELHENSRFAKQDGTWVYLDAVD